LIERRSSGGRSGCWLLASMEIGASSAVISIHKLAFDRVVGIDHVIDREPALHELLDLTADWEAEHTAVGQPGPARADKPQINNHTRSGSKCDSLDAGGCLSRYCHRFQGEPC
jgi:hypothetical protein